MIYENYNKKSDILPEIHCHSVTRAQNIDIITKNTICHLCFLYVS